ncbi:hypothetical protein Q7C36_018600 [Tachysurus vachellii]|uniref:Uncharacterized protein n=1 Tax=Tachysurus vachellii TaxID=175792 RepID=A0AA88M094_TACVA|nr:hypothetical protein Q7C36_018600 [Tachysurus vachellii]
MPAINYFSVTYEERLKEPRLNDLQVDLYLSAGRMGVNERWLPTPISHPHTSCLKKCLQNYFGPRPDVEQAIRSDHVTHRSVWSRKLLIVAFLAVLALAVMGLLLFWNYQCIFVWRMCYEGQDLSSASEAGHI